MKFYFDTDSNPFGDRWYGVTIRRRSSEFGLAIVLSWGTWEGAFVIDREGK